MKSIDELLDALIEREGGDTFTDAPADRGGPTRFGITQQVARAFGYQGDMRLLPRETAAEIYRKRYWSDPRFYDVSLRYGRLAAELFDTGANMGPRVASKFLQRILNVLNRGATDYPDLPVDGGIGELTLHALDGFRQRRGVAGEVVLLCGLDCLRGGRYVEIAEANPSQEVFEYGWLSRVGAEA